jgi:hypothetical protein
VTTQTSAGRHRATPVKPVHQPAAEPSPLPVQAPQPLPARYTPPPITAQAPIMWPIVPAVALFGIFGSLWVRHQMRKAKRQGLSTGPYWLAWTAGFVLHIALVLAIRGGLQ